jgi:ribosomal protein S3
MQTLVGVSRSVDTLLESFWSPLGVLAGKAYVSHAACGATVTVPYWHTEPLSSLNQSTVNALGTQLATLLKVPVHLELVRQLTPLYEAGMLAQFLAGELTSATFRSVILKLFSSIGPVSGHGSVGSQQGTLVGVKVRLAGRLLKEASRPRQTLQTASLGSLTASLKHVLQAASHTVSNQKGSYTVKVWLCIKL